MASITFLGTGGGRFVLLSQRRYTGGIWLEAGIKAVIDPGPGSLIRAIHYKKDPQKLDAVFVSHNHIDHYNDAELLIEAMTRGMKRRHGTVVVNRNTLDYIADYHKTLVDVVSPEAGESFTVGGLPVQTTPTENHEGGIGYKFSTTEGTVTYSSDTAYSDKLIEYYKGSRVLVLNTMFPTTKEMEVHLNTKTAAKVIEKARPDLAVLQHFGMTMLNANPDKEAAWITEETGVRTIAARDGMTIEVGSLAVSDYAKKGGGRQVRL